MTPSTSRSFSSTWYSLAALYRFGSRVNMVARVAILLNGIVLVIFLIPLVTPLFDPRAPKESPSATRILLPATALLALQLAGMVLLFPRNLGRPKP